MTVRFILAVLLALSASLALLGQNAQETYQRGLVQEQATGNLPEAIKLYSQALKSAGKDRALAARALIRIAGAQEKLGRQSEAADAYAEILQSYPEQREQAVLAQERLDALRRAFPTIAERVPGPGLQDVSSVTGALFQNYCASCHNASIKSGGLDMGSLNAKNVAENTAMWENILRRLQARRDPPSGLPRPDDRTYRAVIMSLQQALDRAYPASGPRGSAERVTDMELASRIAALVWGAAPDAPLLEDARRGRLQDDSVVEQQVTRMLRDPKSSYLISSFFEPWLLLDKLKMAQIDPALFPQFDAELLQSMETETRLFLESQLRENHDALELWTANYTYVNERLARHYGIGQISGREFRRVTWPDDARAGILGQAGSLTALSMSSRTSPTKRGLYLFQKFLGMDAPPPPASVPAMVETPDTRARTMRDRLAAHTSNPACANCHANFDPLGLALENFDAVGQWRTAVGGFSIDASGAFIDGTRFGGPAEFRSGLLKYRDAYYSNLTQQLLAHALNRKGRARIYDYEMPSVRAIVRTASSRDYRWSSIISGIVSSTPFQMRNIVP
jgi:tetratricopeptide (TPR) repeat protein